MDISVRDIHNYMIKPSDNSGFQIVADSVTQKFLISDTTLRLFISPHVIKMTPVLCQICGCEICIIPKDIYIYLNGFITNLVIYLQHNYVGRHTHKSVFSTTSTEYYKQKLFPGGEILHAAIKDVAHCISCTPVKPNNIMHINFDSVSFMIVLST